MRSNSSQNDNLDDEKTQELEIRNSYFEGRLVLVHIGFHNASVSRSNGGLVSPCYLQDDHAICKTI